MPRETQKAHHRFLTVLLPASRPATERVWNPTDSAWGPMVVLVLLCGALFFYGINIGQLYRTESLRAIIAAEMLRSGDWLVPRLYGEPFMTKPPGMYAAIAAASLPFGEVSEWTARLPSALAATVVVLVMYWYVSRHVGRLGGLVVAAITPCGFLWLDKASAAEIDMLQVAWTAASLLFFFRAVEASEDDMQVGAASRAAPGSGSARRTYSRGHALFFWLAALLCVAGGVLTKWTAPLFFYATAIPFLIWRKQFRLLFCWQHLLSAAIGASLCFGWVAAVVHEIGWDTLFNTVYGEAAPRISYEKHVGSHPFLKALAHPFRLFLVNLPWSAFALFTLWPGFLRLWDERGRRLVQAFQCWALPSAALFTLLPEHATRHSFPLFPGIAALGGLAWFAVITGWLPGRLASWHVRLALSTLVFFGLVVVGGSVAGFIVLPNAAWWLVVLAAIMGCWCVREGFRAYREVRLGGLLTALICAWLVCKFAFLHIYMPVRTINRDPRGTAAILSQHVPEGKTLHLFRLKDEGIMFYYARPVRRLRDLNSLPDAVQTVYCVVMENEWKEVQGRDDWQIVSETQLKDEQGDPMVLLELERHRPSWRNASLVSAISTLVPQPCLPMFSSSRPARRF